MIDPNKVLSRTQMVSSINPLEKSFNFIAGENLCLSQIENDLFGQSAFTLRPHRSKTAADPEGPAAFNIFTIIYSSLNFSSSFT